MINFTKMTQYALDNITDYLEFESMCSDLMFRAGFKNLKPHGGMHDNGIDAVTYVHEADSRIIFQYSTQRNVPTKVKETLATLRKNGEQCNQLHYVSSREISYSTAKDLIDFAESEYNAKLEIYDREWIRLRLDNDSADLKKKYFGLVADQEYNVDYKAYWMRTEDGSQSYVIEIYWLDQSEVPVLQTNITATPSPSLKTRMSELTAKGGFNFPTLLFLENIASLCQFHFHTQSIDDETVENNIVIQDTSDGRRDFTVHIETFRLIPMPDVTTVLYLLNYVPGVCDSIREDLDREISIEERKFYALMVRGSGITPRDIGVGRAVRASDLLVRPSTLLWATEPDEGDGKAN